LVINMYNEFVNSFDQTLKMEGYTRINMPENVHCPGEIALWGRETSSMTYFYVTYNTKAMDTGNFAPVKQFVDQCLQTVTERISARNSVAFNIFVGDLDGDVKAHIDRAEDFALMPQYDMYLGVDGFGNVRHHGKAPVSTDKCLKKITDTLARMSGEKPVLQSEVVDMSHFAQPVAKVPIFAYTIIGVNVLMFVLMELAGGSTDSLTLLNFGAAQFYFTFEFGEYHRLFTPMFLHIGLWHLLTNTMWIIVAGIRMERYLGHWRFLLIYLVSGTVGNVAMMVASPAALGAGASGAVSGIFGALFAFMLVTKKRIENLDLRLMGTLIVVSVVMGFAMNFMVADANPVGNAAHIGGLVAGFLLGLGTTKWKV